MTHDILIVDDEEDIRNLVSDILQDEGYKPCLAGDSAAALAAVDRYEPTAVILDIWLQGSELDGLGILEVIKRKYPLLPVIMVSGHGNIETAVNSIKRGAYDYIEKPFNVDRLLLVVKRAIENARLKKENAELRLRVDTECTLIGRSSSMNQLRTTIDKVALTSSRVMVSGPAGVGKEVVARLIHKKSKRAKAPFITLNAASLSPNAIDAELFGGINHPGIAEKTHKIGVLERAHGGTLFIDGVTELPLPAQAKLLRVLQDQSFEQPGTGKIIRVDIRVISSSTRDLRSAINTGNLREDLFYRLNVVPLLVPSLSERKDDIPLLCEYFMARSFKLSGLLPRELKEETIARMQSYNWPGNVRQLKNVIEWMLIMAPEGNSPIGSEILPPEISSSASVNSLEANVDNDVMALSLREAREIFEKQYLLAQLGRFGGNISRTAHFIGMERSALHRKLKSLNITCVETASV